MVIYVFVGKKLISTDSIAPILLELKSHKPKSNVVIITPDTQTLEAIKANLTLFHVIKNNCKIRNLGGLDKNKIKRLAQKISWATQLLFIFLSMLFGTAKTIHFGLLEHPQRGWITKLNQKKVYYMESNGWGTGDLHLRFISNSRVVKPAPVVKSSHNLVSFSENWPLLAVPKNKSLNCYYVTRSKLWPAWNDYLSTEGKDQWLTECKRIRIANNKPVISYLLGTFNELPTLDTGETDALLIKTLTAINEANKDVSILLKPHAITELKRLDIILKSLNFENVYISYLHPGVMARNSVAVICNYYSTAIADYWHSGVPTIEFTRYSGQLLRVTNNRSFGGDYIDYFIDMTEFETLKTTIKNCFAMEEAKKRSTRRTVRLTDTDKLLLDALV